MNPAEAVFAEKTDTLEWRKKTFTFRPLKIMDLVKLLHEDGNATETLLNSIDDISELTNFVEKIPTFAARVIAASTNEDYDFVLKLPIGVVISSLVKVISVSEVDTELLGKLVATLSAFSESLIETKDGLSSQPFPPPRPQ